MVKNKLIYLITEGKLTSRNFQTGHLEVIETIKIAIDCGIDLIQIREKSLDASSIFELTCGAVSIAKSSNTKILVNERFDIALAAKADGVHLTSSSIPISVVRQLAPQPFMICVSTHSAEAIDKARSQGADFVTFSPIFEVADKPKPQGLGTLKEITERFNPFPVIALGGIDQTNCADILNIASGLASIRFLNDTNQLRTFSKNI